MVGLGPIPQCDRVKRNAKPMLTDSTDRILRQAYRDASLGVSPFVHGLFRALGGTRLISNRLPGFYARLIMLGFAIYVSTVGGGCRSPEPKYSSPGSVDSFPSDSLQPARSEALLRAEAANMAVDDQKRAQEGYERVPKEKYPPRDYPIEPAIRP